MNNICNLNTITWTDPFSRWFWEAVCGKGGIFLTVVAVLGLLLYVILKKNK